MTHADLKPATGLDGFDIHNQLEKVLEGVGLSASDCDHRASATRKLRGRRIADTGRCPGDDRNSPVVVEPCHRQLPGRLSRSNPSAHS